MYHVLFLLMFAFALYIGVLCQKRGKYECCRLIILYFGFLSAAYHFLALVSSLISHGVR